MAFLTQTMLGSLSLNPVDSPASLSSTAPEWIATFDLNAAETLDVGETKTSNISDVAIDAFNNVYSIGAARHGSNSFNVLMKQDSAGAIEWQKFFPQGTFPGGFDKIAVDAFGNIWVLTLVAVDREIRYSLLLKFDSAGDLLASILPRVIQGTTTTGERFQANGLTLDPVTGDVYVFGVQYNICSFILKISNTGELLNQFLYSQLAVNSIRSLALDSASNMYVSTISPDISMYDNSKQPGGLAVIKLNPAGTVIWQNAVNLNLGMSRTSQNEATAILLIDPADNVYVFGGATSLSSSTTPALAKLSPQGSLIWSKKFSDKPSTFNGSVQSMSFDESGSILLHCMVMRADQSLTVKQTITSISPSGKFNWKKLFFSAANSNRELIFRKIWYSPDGAILIPGNFRVQTQSLMASLMVKINIKSSTATQFGEVTDVTIINDPYSVVAHTASISAGVTIVKSSPATQFYRSFRVDKVAAEPAATLSSMDTEYTVTLV